MEHARATIDGACTLAIGAYPEAMVLVLEDVHDGRGDGPGVGGAGEVMASLTIGIEAEQASIVGAYPKEALVVAQERGDAVVAHGVVAKRLGAIVVEIDGIVGDDEDAFLIEGHPDVAIARDGHGVYLLRAGVDLRIVELTGRHGAELAVVDEDAIAIGADIHLLRARDGTQFAHGIIIGRSRNLLDVV